ncbi:TolC family protein [Persephonella sp.]
MNMKIIFRLLNTTIVSIILLITFSYGETIEEIIEQGRKANPELLKLQEKLKIYQYREIYEGSLEDPVATLSINDIQLFYRPFSRNIEPMQAVIFGISQKIPYFGKLDLKKEIVQKTYDSEYYKLKSVEQKILKDIYLSAYRIWQIEEKLRIIKQYQDVATQVIKLSNTLYAVGKVSQSDVINAQIYYTQLKEMEINLDFSLKREKAHLVSLIKKKIDTVDIKPVFPENNHNFEELKERLKENNPYLRYIQKKIEQKKIKIALAKKDYKPDFKLFANYAYRQGFYDYVSVGISFNIPLWQKSRQDMKLLESVQDKLATEKEYEQFLTELTYRLEDKYYSLKDSFETYRLLEESFLKQTEKGFESIIAEYKVGNKNMLDLLFSLKQILSVKLKIIDELYLYNTSLIEIKELVGELK